jgi:hypothetical protein
MRVLLSLALSATTLLSSDSDRVSASVTVLGGPHAGGYYVTNADSPCEITSQKPPNPNHSFDVMVGDGAPSADSTKLTVLMVTIPDADVKGENHTFFASIIFGGVGAGRQYVVDSRPGHSSAGSGIVTVATRGHDAIVAFDVVPTSGVAFRGTILCSDVSRN